MENNEPNKEQNPPVNNGENTPNNEPNKSNNFDFEKYIKENEERFKKIEELLSQKNEPNKETPPPVSSSSNEEKDDNDFDKYCYEHYDKKRR